MVSVDTKRLGAQQRELLWGALHRCLLPAARRAYPGLPARSWDNYSHFLGVRLHTPSMEGEVDRLHLDSTFFTAICSLSDGFGGGGTFFPTEYAREAGVGGQDYNATGVLLRPPTGSCLFYDGALLHAANPVARWGERAIAIFFFHSFLGKAVGEALDFDPPPPLDEDGVVQVELGGGGGSAAVRAALLEAGFVPTEDSHRGPRAADEL